MLFRHSTAHDFVTFAVVLWHPARSASSGSGHNSTSGSVTRTEGPPSELLEDRGAPRGNVTGDQADREATNTGDRDKVDRVGRTDAVEQGREETNKGKSAANAEGKPRGGENDSLPRRG